MACQHHFWSDGKLASRSTQRQATRLSCVLKHVRGTLPFPLCIPVCIPGRRTAVKMHNTHNMLEINMSPTALLALYGSA
jgi:hypothetical protein